MRSFIYILLLINFIACNNASSDTFTLEGYVEEAGDSESVLLHYLSFENDKWHKVSDTAKITDGKFFFEGKIDELTAADLCFENTSIVVDIHIYLEPTTMKLIVDKSKPYAYELSGTKVEKENIELRIELEPNERIIYENIESLQHIFKQLSLSGDNASIRDSLMNIIEQKRPEMIANNEIIDKKRLDFISKHPSYRIVPDLLYLTTKRRSADINTIKHIYNNLSEQSKETLMGKLANKQIEYTEKQMNIKTFAVGDISPDFVREDTSGKRIQLSQFINQNYILLDFWASWCGPCIKEIPKIKDLHKQYSDNGLAIIGISLDTDKDSWLKAMDKYELKAWPQVLSITDTDETVFIENDISDYYNVELIPAYILIDKQGKIIAKWEHIGEEQLVELDKILKNK